MKKRILEESTTLFVDGDHIGHLWDGENNSRCKWADRFISFIAEDKDHTDIALQARLWLYNLQEEKYTDA